MFRLYRGMTKTTQFFNSLGILISQYKDPYKPTSKLESRRVFFLAQLDDSIKKEFSMVENLINLWFHRSTPLFDLLDFVFWMGSTCSTQYWVFWMLQLIFGQLVFIDIYHRNTSKPPTPHRIPPSTPKTLTKPKPRERPVPNSFMTCFANVGICHSSCILGDFFWDGWRTIFSSETQIHGIPKLLWV